MAQFTLRREGGSRRVTSQRPVAQMATKTLNRTYFQEKRFGFTSGLRRSSAFHRGVGVVKINDRSIGGDANFLESRFSRGSRDFTLVIWRVTSYQIHWK